MNCVVATGRLPSWGTGSYVSTCSLYNSGSPPKCTRGYRERPRFRRPTSRSRPRTRPRRLPDSCNAGSGTCDCARRAWNDDVRRLLHQFVRLVAVADFGRMTDERARWADHEQHRHFAAEFLIDVMAIDVAGAVQLAEGLFRHLFVFAVLFPFAELAGKVLDRAGGRRHVGRIAPAAAPNAVHDRRDGGQHDRRDEHRHDGDLAGLGGWFCRHCQPPAAAVCRMWASSRSSISWSLGVTMTVATSNARARRYVVRASASRPDER